MKMNTAHCTSFVFISLSEVGVYASSVIYQASKVCIVKTVLIITDL